MLVLIWLLLLSLLLLFLLLLLSLILFATLTTALIEATTNPRKPKDDILFSATHSVSDSCKNDHLNVLYILPCYSSFTSGMKTTGIWSWLRLLLFKGLPIRSVIFPLNSFPSLSPHSHWSNTHGLRKLIWSAKLILQELARPGHDSQVLVPVQLQALLQVAGTTTQGWSMDKVWIWSW